MSELKAINKLKTPNTRTSLHRDFMNLRLEKGMTVIVHSSLSSLGWVCGGPVAVVQALMDAVGEEGTIVMPTQTNDNSDPSGWQMPPVPEDWWPIIREEMPAYEPEVTPSRGMGKIVETFRTFPEVKRSLHPTYSFAAWGKHADFILSEQPLEEGLGSSSPLEKIYELDGHVLLLGVGHDSNTSLHLAEHAIPNRGKVQKGAALIENKERVWKTYEEILYDSDVFEALGKEFEEKFPINCSKVGLATSKLMKQRVLVDYGREWLQKYRG
ncbi:aminoglycoside N(3)-acetyltransferase [Bacillus sp. S/N-304-OC-R1]|uniref:aminoglycoside N(3)-acetyltransferase n=1 Tax=Bacillus sp. S/N-304-OC-R1 TaxID=2758034 RepID=UPI001C8ECAB3|nr:AAC(3) family N-acetyltransferase [Bacillus sp. S/N-304-OC-R1]MBY0122267.1 AAC(3) family N-acetyltransferase [Bacillus sp. S/N-304-OC-R1]